MYKLKMIPNILSGLRILLTLFFLYIIFRTINDDPAYLQITIIIYVAICCTDFCDGKVARYLKAESKCGMILDLAADAFFIFSTSIYLSILKVLPVWVPLMMLFKFMEFIITSRILAHKNTLVFDPVGRVAAVFFYIIPIWTLLFWSNPLLMALFLIITVSTTLLSSSFRMWACLKSISKAS